MSESCTCGVYPPSIWSESTHMLYCPLGRRPPLPPSQAVALNAVTERDALVRALRSLREAMKHDSKGEWGWEDGIEPYLGGALSLHMDVDRILAILRGESPDWPES